MTHTFKDLALSKKILTAEQSKRIDAWEARSRIDDWYWNGLISAEQQEKMYDMSGFLTPPSTKRPRRRIVRIERPPVKIDWMQMVVLLAIGCIVWGCTALIAAHWFIIPVWAKLLGYFSMSFVLATALFKRFDVIRERNVLSVANIGWVFAGIALIGQVFHLNGSLGGAVALGAVLSFPFVCAITWKARFVLWLAVLGAAVFFSPFNAYLLPLMVGLLPVLWWRRGDMGLAVAWTGFVLLSFVCRPWLSGVLYLWDNLMPTAIVWVVLSGLFLTTIALRVVFGAGKPLIVCVRTVYVFLAIGLVVLADVLYSSGLVSAARIPVSLEWILATAIVPLLGISLLPRERRAVAAFSWLLFGVFVGIFSLIPFSVCGMILTVVFLLFSSIFGAVRGSVRLFNVCLMLILLRVIIAYIDVVLSFASTGLGLISLGALILAGIWLYKRFFNGLWLYVQQGGAR